MDEPFSALDEFTREKLHVDLLRILHKTNKTIIFVTTISPKRLPLRPRLRVFAAPRRLSTVVDIDLPRPRTLQTKQSPEFYEYINKIRNSFEGV
jgi:NitT/TauT family transport system ATP-binding protein